MLHVSCLQTTSRTGKRSSSKKNGCNIVGCAVLPTHPARRRHSQYSSNSDEHVTPAKRFKNMDLHHADQSEEKVV